MNTVQQKTAQQVLEAPAGVLATIGSAARLLDVSDEGAAEVSRTGEIFVAGRCVGVAMAPGDGAVVLSCAIDAAWCEDASRRLQALRACTALLMNAGAAICQTPAGPTVMARHCLTGDDIRLLARKIEAIALLAQAIDRRALAHS